MSIFMKRKPVLFADYLTKLKDYAISIIGIGKTLVMQKVSAKLPNHVDRIKGLGNAVVPEQAKEAFKTLMGLK